MRPVKHSPDTIQHDPDPGAVAFADLCAEVREHRFYICPWNVCLLGEDCLQRSRMLFAH